MGLIRRKDNLTSGARRFLEAAAAGTAAGTDAKGRPLPGQARPLALSTADAKSILKDLDWDAPEAAEFLGAARIPKEALGAFKTGDRPDLLGGVLKDGRVFPYFENFLCCCCCGPCRLCRFYPFCKRRCGRVQVKLSDGSTLWAYRLEVEGVAVEAIPGRPGVAKVSIPGAAGGVALSDFQNHTGNASAHGNYAPASHTAEANPHPDKFAPKSADPNGYADKAELAGKAPRVWDGATPTAELPSGYAPATGSGEYAPAKDAAANPIKYLAEGSATTDGLNLIKASGGALVKEVSTLVHAAGDYAGASHGNDAHAKPFVAGSTIECLLNPPTASGVVAVALAFPSGMVPYDTTLAGDCVKAAWCPAAGGQGSALKVESASLAVSGSTGTLSFKLNAGTTAAPDYYDRSLPAWGGRIVTVTVSVPVKPA